PSRSHRNRLIAFDSQRTRPLSSVRAGSLPIGLMVRNSGCLCSPLARLTILRSISLISRCEITAFTLRTFGDGGKKWNFIGYVREAFDGNECYKLVRLEAIGNIAIIDTIRAKNGISRRRRRDVGPAAFAGATTLPREGPFVRWRRHVEMSPRGLRMPRRA